MNSQIPFDRSTLSPKWQFRFDFFDRTGGPKDPRFKTALKELSFGERIKVGTNFYAFFFGFIYFFILGLWRKALALVGISLALGVLGVFLPDMVVRAFGFAFTLLTAMAANYAFYLDRVKGSTSWNPYEGVRWW